MELSKRLMMIAGMVTPGNRLADIGTDHGFIPIKLVSEGIVPSALAMDVGKGPLERAKEHVAAYGLTNQIECRLSDGYEKLEAGEADTTVIAGMGGELMVRILTEGQKRGVLTEELVLSPHSEWEKVRHFLGLSGYHIVLEDMLFEDRKYYVVIKAVRGENPEADAYDMVEEFFGRYLLDHKHPVLLDFLNFKKQRYEKILHNLEGNLSESARNSVDEITKELELIEGACHRYENV